MPLPSKACGIWQRNGRQKNAVRGSASLDLAPLSGSTFRVAVSLKIPVRILGDIPAAGHGRDSGVLLAAWKSAELRSAALRILEDVGREFVSSQRTKLELLPNLAFEKRPVERSFCQSYFDETVALQPLDEHLGNDAQVLGEKYGLAAVDALHIPAALRLRAEEFYASQKPGKPMLRVKEVKVASLHAP